MDTPMRYPTNITEFADKLFWDMTGEEALADQDYFLTFIMARLPRSAFDHVRRNFCFADDDYAHALKNAPRGIFVAEREWIYWNHFFNIEPVLPFPGIYKRQY